MKVVNMWVSKRPSYGAMFDLHFKIMYHMIWMLNCTIVIHYIMANTGISIQINGNAIFDK